MKKSTIDKELSSWNGNMESVITELEKATKKLKTIKQDVFMAGLDSKSVVEGLDAFNLYELSEIFVKLSTVYELAGTSLDVDYLKEEIENKGE